MIASRIVLLRRSAGPLFCPQQPGPCRLALRLLYHVFPKGTTNNTHNLSDYYPINCACVLPPTKDGLPLDPMTNAFIQMSGVFAELELRIIRERVRSGMRNARAKGAKISRPQTTLDDIPANFLRHYPAYKKGAFNLTELARLCGVSRTTAYKYISLLKTRG